MRFLTIFLFIAIITSLACEKTTTVKITSQPSDALVFIDGVEVGITPYTGRVSPEMPHRIMVSKLGYKSGTAELKRDSGNFTHTFQLEKVDLSNMILIPAGKFLMGTSEEEIKQVIRQLGGGTEETRKAMIDTVAGEDDTLLEKHLEAKEIAEISENVQWFMAEKPQYEVALDAFYIDKLEVTNADYKKFIDATGHHAPRHWENNTYPEGEGNLPVVYVSWKDANAYCQWVGKRLPTEAEWEKAARGTDARIWPWGNEFDMTKCNVEAWEGSGPKPVESYPQGASPYGVFDMAGNVWEWTSSWYDAYPGSTHTTPEFGKKFRVLRGGSWYHYDSLGPMGARCASRDRGTEEHISYVAGFRCAIGKDEVEGEKARE